MLVKPFRLIKYFFNRIAVVGIFFERKGTYYDASSGSYRNTDFGAKFVRFMLFALRNTLCMRLVEGVYFIRTLFLLSKLKGKQQQFLMVFQQ